MAWVIDLTGRKFGRLTVLKRVPNNSKGFSKWYKGQPLWKCLCRCGKIVTILGVSLREGTTKSCGCLRTELSRKKMLKHGMYGTSEYSTWNNMIRRCREPNHVSYKYYGGRGIAVCKRWTGKKGFENFYKDLGAKPSPLHTLDRIKNNKNYKPSNCKWSTPAEQAKNKRKVQAIESFTTLELRAELERRAA